MSHSSSNMTGQFEYDPVFLNSRREAAIVLVVWVIAFLWTTLYCYFNGYRSDIDPDNLELVMGLPSWVVWGIGAPWLVCDLFTLWFALFYMKNDDLGEAAEGSDLAEDQAENVASDQEGTEV